MSNVINFDESIKWVIGGKDYFLKKPTVKQIAWFNEAYKETSSDVSAQFDNTFKFLAEQGLPVEVTEKLNADQLSTVLESLFASKKKV